MPEQEEVISSFELSHPFASAPKIALEFRDHEKSMDDSKFYEICKNLGIPPSSLEKPEFFLYVSKLRRNNGQIDFKLLVVSTILLANCKWNEKLSVLIDLYKKGMWMSQTEVVSMLEDIDHIF